MLSVLESFAPSANATGMLDGSQIGGGSQTLEQHQVPMVHSMVEQPPLDPRVKINPAPIVNVRGTSLATLTEDEQRHYERFRKMDPSQFQGGKTEDAHEFLTNCRELLDVA